MRTFFFATLNCFIRNKPGVAPATLVTSSCVRPAGDVTFVLIRDAKREPPILGPTVVSEMKNVFVAVVQKSRRTDRFEMAERALLNRDQFDPMDCVLQNKELEQLKNDLVRQHR